MVQLNQARFGVAIQRAMHEFCQAHTDDIKQSSLKGYVTQI